MSTVDLTEASDDEDNEIEYVGTLPADLAEAAAALAPPSSAAPSYAPSATPSAAPSSAAPPVPPSQLDLDQEHGGRWGGSVFGVYGPRQEHLTQCANAKPLRDAFDEDIACPYSGVSPLVCTMSPILCQSCSYHRYHFAVGYGRPICCKCMYCQHHPARPIPWDRELEQRFTGIYM